MNAKTSTYFSTDDTTIVIEKKIAADLETPVSAYYKLRASGAVFLLESVEHGSSVGRYSFIGLRPNFKAIINQSGLRIAGAGGYPAPIHPLKEGGEPLEALSMLFSLGRPGAEFSGIPLLGGLAGYVSYDMVRYFERISDAAADLGDAVLAEFFFIDTLLAFDHVNHRMSILKLSTPGNAEEGEESVRQLAEILRAPIPIVASVSNPLPHSTCESTFTPSSFCSAVDVVQENIRRGEIYQLVLSQRVSGTTSADPFTIYRTLPMLNPSPYMYYFDFGSRQIIGSSPETLVTLTGRQARVRPIAGTRPRGSSPSHDRELAINLRADEKECAEHVMLVDLGRNDLGRVCKFGSVSVDELMEIERFSHVMHMSSTVTGELRDDVAPLDLFRATFPAGTVSGAPKIRAMQLIESLEPVRRGVYAGAIGYVSLSGDMDWCIGIRTIVIENGRYHLQAGAGIVADSAPLREYEETLHKMAALKQAIATAEAGGI